MSLPVKLRDVAHEMQESGEFVTCYINVATGELVALSEEAIDLVDEEDTDGLKQSQLDEIRLASKVLESEDFFELPKSSEIDHASLVEDFARSLAEDDRKQRLLDAASGRAAMSRLKHLIDHLDLHDAWLDFRNAAFEEAAAAFLEGREVPYTRD